MQDRMVKRNALFDKYTAQNWFSLNMLYFNLNSDQVICWGGKKKNPKVVAVFSLSVHILRGKLKF